MASVTYTEMTMPTHSAATSVATPVRHTVVSDPLVHIAGLLLSVPLYQVYALMWRAGWLTLK